MNDLILFLLQALVGAALTGAFLYVSAKSTEQGERFARALVSLFRAITPWMRNVFNPNTAGARWVKSLGVNPVFADQAMEWLADQLKGWEPPSEAPHA